MSRAVTTSACLTPVFRSADSPRTTSALDGWGDVLVHPEEIGRVVLLLEREQAIVVPAVGVSDPLASFIAEVVYVDFPDRCGRTASKNWRVQQMFWSVAAESVQLEMMTRSYCWSRCQYAVSALPTRENAPCVFANTVAVHGDGTLLT